MDSVKQAEEWAKHQALTEEKAFDYAIRSTNIDKTEFEIDDQYEQAYRAGYKAAEKKGIKMIDVIAKENADLRITIRQQADRINRLSEALRRGAEEEWE